MEPRNKELSTGDLPIHLLEDIRAAAVYCKLEKIVLFGSRARGTHRPRSDIDLVVSGGDINRLWRCLTEDTWTLLQFDVVDLSLHIDDDLRTDIEKEGITLYESK